jgi:hypothetical protein
LFSADEENNRQTACCRAAINKLPTSTSSEHPSSALLGTNSRQKTSNKTTLQQFPFTRTRETSFETLIGALT